MLMRLMSLLIIASVFFMQGCETAKGMKKDVTNLVEGTVSKDGWAKKTDNWMRENMW